MICKEATSCSTNSKFPSSLTTTCTPPPPLMTHCFKETRETGPLHFPCQNPAVSYEVSLFPLKITTDPVAVEDKSSQCKNMNFPNFLNSEHTMSILREEKLKKAWKRAARQKKLREREENREAKRKEKEEKKR